MKRQQRALLWAAVLLLSIKQVCAIPTAGIIPIIGPIIAQTALVISSAVLFVVARVTKHKKAFMIGGGALLGIAVLLIVLDVL